jgi:hypothetical protein
MLCLHELKSAANFFFNKRLQSVWRTDAGEAM